MRTCQNRAELENIGKDMIVRFYGTRGSLPTPEPDRMQYGGNTACVLVCFDSGLRLILDAGTGIRQLGQELWEEGGEAGDLYLLLSHTHWDHIQGLPFFRPFYNEKQVVHVIRGCKDKASEALYRTLSGQMQKDYFPIELGMLSADIRYWGNGQGSFMLEKGISITAFGLKHPCKPTYGYRIQEREKVLIYCTDIEHVQGIDRGAADFCQGADLLIHDAQYTPNELEKRNGWGHSSWEQALELGQRCEIGRIALFHHDPAHNDSFLSHMEKKAQNRFAGAFLAREAQEIAL